MPLSIQVRSSWDGKHYDTENLAVIKVKPEAGKRVQQTVELNAQVRFIKFVVENLDPNEAVTDLKLIVTLGG
jgi:hypothetical protein